MAGHDSMEVQLSRFLHRYSPCLAKSAGGALAVACCDVAYFSFIIGRVQCKRGEGLDAPGAAIGK